MDDGDSILIACGSGRNPYVHGKSLAGHHIVINLERLKFLYVSIPDHKERINVEGRIDHIFGLAVFLHKMKDRARLVTRHRVDVLRRDFESFVDIRITAVEYFFCQFPLRVVISVNTEHIQVPKRPVFLEFLLQSKCHGLHFRSDLCPLLRSQGYLYSLLFGTQDSGFDLESNSVIDSAVVRMIKVQILCIEV